MTLAELKTLLETRMLETGNGSKPLRFHVRGTGPLDIHEFAYIFWDPVNGRFMIVVEEIDEQSRS